MGPIGAGATRARTGTDDAIPGAGGGAMALGSDGAAPTRGGGGGAGGARGGVDPAGCAPGEKCIIVRVVGDGAGPTLVGTGAGFALAPGGAGTTETGGIVAAGVSAPHWPQNLTRSGSGCPQCAQERVIIDPVGTSRLCARLRGLGLCVTKKRQAR